MEKIIQQSSIQEMAGNINYKTKVNESVNRIISL